MPGLPRVTGAEELLDAPTHDPNELRRSLAHVAQVNRWLGGSRSLIGAFRKLGSRSLRVLDLGTGSADLPRALVRWARQSGITIDVTATDLHPQMLEIAREAGRDYPEIRIERADALELPFADRSFDVVMLSLTLHHFDRADQLRVLQQAARVARNAVIVSELERTRANYIGARLLAATWWRRNRLTRHDGPLSVLRGFRAAELVEIAKAAGLRSIIVQRCFFYRLVLTAAPDDRRAASAIV